MAVAPSPPLPLLLLFLAAVLLTSSLSLAAATDNSSAEVNAASVVLPMQGSVFPEGYFYVSMDIGNPPKPYILDVDSGSDLSWVYCKLPGSNYLSAPNPPYVPKTLVSCEDPKCISLHQSLNLNHSQYCNRYSKKECDYKVEYMDRSWVGGVLVIDQISIKFSNSTAIPSQVAFGCTLDRKDEPSRKDGLIGLGRGRPSLISQLRDKGITRDVVGHCLGRGGASYLFIGDGLIPPSGVTWAPMTKYKNTNYYRPGQASVSLDQRPIGVTETVVIDSGTSYTYFPNTSYQTFLTALRSYLRSKPIRVVGDPPQPFLACWTGPTPFRSVADARPYFPNWTLNFGSGGSAVQLELTPEDYLVVLPIRGIACLGVENGAADNVNNFILFGDVTLQDLIMIYDNEKQQIGWKKAVCSQSPVLKALP